MQSAAATASSSNQRGRWK